MTDIVSIDLGIKPTSLGLCVIQNGQIQLPSLDKPTATAFAEYRKHWRDADGGNVAADAAAAALHAFVVALKPRVVVIDGPQGFAQPGRGRRRAEAILRTSGRTGAGFETPIKGFSWPGISRVGIKLFNRLHAAGYLRLTAPGVGDDRVAVEVFPDSCWHSFGLGETPDELRRLQLGVEMKWEKHPNEHQLDAAVGALTVLAARQGQAVFVGHPFFLDAGEPREGYLVIPNPGRDWLSG